MTTTTHSAATLRAVLSRSLPAFVAAAAVVAAAVVVIFHFISIIHTIMIAFIPAI